MRPARSGPCTPRPSGITPLRTFLGDVKLEGNRLTKLWGVGQWQGGEYKGVAPASMTGAVKTMLN